MRRELLQEEDYRETSWEESLEFTESDYPQDFISKVKAEYLADFYSQDEQ